jgi:hypothetical protein
VQAGVAGSIPVASTNFPLITAYSPMGGVGDVFVRNYPPGFVGALSQRCKNSRAFSEEWR